MAELSKQLEMEHDPLTPPACHTHTQPTNLCLFYVEKGTFLLIYVLCCLCFQEAINRHKKRLQGLDKKDGSDSD